MKHKHTYDILYTQCYYEQSKKIYKIKFAKTKEW